MIKPYISNGNIRMDIPTFSLPSHETCPGSTPHCRRFCYAQKAERRFPRVRSSRNRNLEISRRNDFVELMIEQIKKIKSDFFRIHESGDMYSNHYLFKWFEIIKHFPEKHFLTYTQSYNLDWDKKPENLVVYWSVWDDSKNVPEDGLHAYVIDNKHHRLRPYQIPSDVKLCKKGKNLKCNDCMYCFKGLGDVVFQLH